MIPELRPAESRGSKANGRAKFPYVFTHPRYEEHQDGAAKSRACFTQPSPDVSRVVDEVEVSDSADEIPCTRASYYELHTSSAALGKLRSSGDNRSSSNSARTLTPASSASSMEKQVSPAFPPFVFAGTKHLTRFKRVRAKRDAQGKPVRSDYCPGDGFSSSEVYSASLLHLPSGSTKRARTENDAVGTRGRTPIHRLQLAVPDETGVHKSLVRSKTAQEPPSSRSRQVTANLSNQLSEHAVAGSTDSDALTKIHPDGKETVPKGTTAKVRKVQVETRSAGIVSPGSAVSGLPNEAQDEVASQRVIAEAPVVNARQVHLTKIELSSVAPEAQDTS